MVVRKLPPWLASDELWGRVESLLPVRQQRTRNAQRFPLDGRGCLQGILFVLHTGIRWVPQELGFGSGMTCRRRLRDWNEDGVWDKLHLVLLEELPQAGRLDWSRAVIDGSHRRALKGGPKPVRVRPTMHGPGSKHHMISHANGTPLAVTLTGGNRFRTGCGRSRGR